MNSKHLKSVLNNVCTQVWECKSLEEGKKIILDHIYSTGIKDVDKKKITNSVNGCKSKYKLDYYLVNSVLMFEGMGLNPKVNVSVGVEVEMV